MADLVSAFTKVNDVEGRQDSIGSEAQYTRFGSNDNYLKDNLDAEIALRVSGDSTIATSINNLETEINAKVVNILLFVGQWTTSVAYNAAINRTVSAVFAVKDTTLNQTSVRIQIFDDVNDVMAVDVTQLTPFATSAWDVHIWNLDANNKIHSVFFKYKTISL